MAIEDLPELEAPFRKIIWPLGMIVIASPEYLWITATQPNADECVPEEGRVSVPWGIHLCKL